MKISVKDQGIGIPERHLDKIFDSVPNEGTTVHVYLPASDEASLSGGKEREGIPRGEGRVLLIDDEEMIRKAGSEALTRLGYAVTLAAVGAEGARMYEEAMKGGRPFDVVLLDLTVPGGKGGAGHGPRAAAHPPERKGHRFQRLFQRSGDGRLPCVRLPGGDRQVVPNRRTGRGVAQGHAER